MWRYLAGGAAALLMVALGVLVYNARARSDAVPPMLPAMTRTGDDAQATPAGTPLPDTVPEASERTREQKRFDRYDKDRNGSVTREEYLAARRKAFAKLDSNHDGVLGFDEWAVKAEAKFATADHDHSNALTAAEFATTAVKRKPRRVNCPPPQERAQPSGQDD